MWGKMRRSFFVDKTSTFYLSIYAHGRRLCGIIGFDMEVQPLVTHNVA